MKGLIWMMLTVGCLALSLALTGCDESILPTSANEGSLTHENSGASQILTGAVGGQEPAGDSVEGVKGCDAIKVVQRRGVPGSPTVVLEVYPTIDFDSPLYVKFIRDNCGIPQYLRILLDLEAHRVYQVALPKLPCGPYACSTDFNGNHQVFVWVEGRVNDKLIQCDGSVFLQYPCDDCDSCECRGDCPPPLPPSCPVPIPKKPREDCTWLDHPDCRWECGRECEGCECDNSCVQCEDVPPEHSFSLSKAIGNPRAECSYFGDYVPGSPGAFYVTKCGTFYEVTLSPWTSALCSNGQELSHSTGCVCDGEE